jgi:hypothetical protein
MSWRGTMKIFGYFFSSAAGEVSAARLRADSCQGTEAMEEVGGVAISRFIRQPIRKTHDAFGVGLFDSSYSARLRTFFGPRVDSPARRSSVLGTMANVSTEGQEARCCGRQPVTAAQFPSVMRSSV